MKILLKLLPLFLICGAVEARAKGDSHESWEKYKKNVLRSLGKVQGWCSPEKAERMMDLIHETAPEVCVEIGVFGGSSIYPTASALRYQQSGVVYAIDPWKNEDCLVGYPEGDINRDWWDEVDLDQIYDGFLSMLNFFHLTPYCIVMRMTSEEALCEFEDESIDILHIDGNHSEMSALYDAQNYLPKVKVGGYIWFDDINWTIGGFPSTQTALSFLSNYCVLEEAYSSSSYALLRRVE